MQFQYNNMMECMIDLGIIKKMLSTIEAPHLQKE